MHRETMIQLVGHFLSGKEARIKYLLKAKSKKLPTLNSIAVENISRMKVK